MKYIEGINVDGKISEAMRTVHRLNTATGRLLCWRHNFEY